MKLYELQVYLENSLKGTFFVVAKSETEASEYLMKKWRVDWQYTTFAYVGNIKLIAYEDQFGQPSPLLFVTA